MNAITVNLSFNPALLKAIDKAATRESRSRSELIRQAARMYIERRRKWDDVFALGEKTARKNKLTPADIEVEISAHRKSK